MPGARVSNSDTVMLRVEDPVHPNVGTGVMIFDAPIDFERLKLAVEARLLRHDRFRQRVVPPLLPWSTPTWKDDAAFDLRYHVKQVSLPPPGDEAALRDLVSLLASIPLDLDRPLWQLHLVDNYGAGCALICQVHHSVADGMALMHVLLSLADTDPDAPPPAIVPRHQLRPAARSWRSRLGSATRTGMRLTQTGLGTVAHPQRVIDLARLGMGAASAVTSLVLSPRDSDTLLRGEPGVAKRVAWSTPIPLADVKAVGRQLGATVNDVLLTVVAGAMRRYLQDRGKPVSGIRLHALVPISLRTEGTENELGNRFGVIFLPLPVEIADPLARLREVKRQVDAQKHSPKAPIVQAGMRVFGGAPAALVKPAVDHVCRQATVVVTNVRGPGEPIYMAGARMQEFMFWIPRLGGIGVGISIMSYAGEVRVGAISDECVVSDPEALLAYLHDELDALLGLPPAGVEAPSLPELLVNLDEALTALEELLASDTGRRETPRPEAR